MNTLDEMGLPGVSRGFLRLLKSAGSLGDGLAGRAASRQHCSPPGRTGTKRDCFFPSEKHLKCWAGIDPIPPISDRSLGKLRVLGTGAEILAPSNERRGI